MKFSWNFSGIFWNFPQNWPEIFTTFRNSYEFHSQNFDILPTQKFFINNYYIYKIYPTISTDQNCPNVYTYERRKIQVSSADKNCIITFWCSIRRNRLSRSYWIPKSPIIWCNFWTSNNVFCKNLENSAVVTRMLPKTGRKLQNFGNKNGQSLNFVLNLSIISKKPMGE